MRIRKNRDIVGISLIISAVFMSFLFLINCIRKKNASAAFAAVVAISAIGGLCALKRKRMKNNGYTFDFFDSDNYEVFDDSEADKVDRAVNAGLHRKHDADNKGDGCTPIYKIPVDDETTEADFTK